MAVRLREVVVDSRPLFAGVTGHNRGPMRVLEKCGFERIAEERSGDTPVLVLRLG